MPGSSVSPCRRQTQHRRHLGRRRRLLEHQCLQPRDHGVRHTQHRPHRQGGRAFHGLVRPAELHRRAGLLHPGPAPLPHRPAHDRDARLGPGDRRRYGDAGHAPQAPRLHERAVRQEPPGRPGQTSADASTASTSSSATSTTSTPRRSRRATTTRRIRSSGSGSAPAACSTPGPTARAAKSRTPVP